jgi:hypothetical protein
MYNTEIVAGSLLINETRKLARLMLIDSSAEAWKHAIVVDNLLQKKTQATAKRMGNLIRHRMEMGEAPIWSLIAQSDFELAGQAVLVLAIRHSQLLADFMRQVMGLRVRRHDLQLTQKDWDDFLQECAMRESAVAEWSTSTYKKLHEVVLRILAESKFLTSSKEKMIQPVLIRPEIHSYLHNCNDQSTLACLELHQ